MMTKGLSIAFLAVAATSALSAPCNDQAQLETQFGVHQPLGINLLPPPSQPIQIGADQDIRSMRVLLQRTSDAAPGWTVTIRDRLGRPLQSISSRQISDDTPFWTERLPTNFLEFYVETSNAKAPLRGIEYVGISSKAKNPFYSIQGDTPTWKDLYTGTAVPLLLKRRGDSIGMFVGHEGNAMQGVAIWTCTGFVIAREPAVLFVTNDHCGGNWLVSTDRWTSSVCRNAIVDFSWDGDPVSREYSCKAVEARSPENDLAILRLEPIKSDSAPLPLVIRSAAVADETVSIVHHPAALSKQASISCQATTDVGSQSNVNLTRDFAHRCDTEGGSSGAPILDRDGLVAGVHHLGFQNINQSSCDMLNKAVQTQKLIDLLKATPSLTGYTVK